MRETIYLQSDEEVRSLLGVLDNNIRRLEAMTGVEVLVREQQVSINGSKRAVEECKNLMIHLLQECKNGKTVDQLLSEIIAQRQVQAGVDTPQRMAFSHNRKNIAPRTDGQVRYVEHILSHEVVFCIGPAGTGKTYLAMALAIEFLKTKRVERIILTRPAVEAGERLGFLPGDLNAKINPYLRPLFDALYEMMSAEEIKDCMERSVIEIVPLAYMRGRTLNDSFVILDEAQNTTPLQMKMFLTRLGFGSRMVITGDVTQSDIPRGQHSGLTDAATILAPVRPIPFVYLTEKDVVRHSLVKEILRAYEKKNNRSKK